MWYFDAHFDLDQTSNKYFLQFATSYIKTNISNSADWNIIVLQKFAWMTPRVLRPNLIFFSALIAGYTVALAHYFYCLNSSRNTIINSVSLER